jgi:hypothetical protein
MNTALICSVLLVLISNRVGWWLDTLPGDQGYEHDMTLWGIIIAIGAYLILDHLRA